MENWIRVSRARCAALDIIDLHRITGEIIPCERRTFEWPTAAGPRPPCTASLSIENERNALRAGFGVWVGTLAPLTYALTETRYSFQATGTRVMYRYTTRIHKASFFPGVRKVPTHERCSRRLRSPNTQHSRIPSSALPIGCLAPLGVPIGDGTDAASASDSLAVIQPFPA